jgi:16S rRNA C1402 N4-methylase RsmH
MESQPSAEQFSVHFETIGAVTRTNENNRARSAKLRIAEKKIK